MSTTGLHCTNGMLCQMKECTSQFQLCRHDSAFMKKKEDLYEENARLRAEVASLKEELETANFRLESDGRMYAGMSALSAASMIANLTQQLAAANGRIDALMLEHCPDELTKEQLANWAAHQRRANLPEADKEKS